MGIIFSVVLIFCFVAGIELMRYDDEQGKKEFKFCVIVGIISLIGLIITLLI